MTDAFTDDTRDWVDKRGFTLSDRVWSNRADMRDNIDRILREGVINGTPVEEVATRLVRYVSPAYSQSGDGKAEHAANRLAGNEMRRAHGLATQQVALVDPIGGYLKYVVDAIATEWARTLPLPVKAPPFPGKKTRKKVKA